jgi:hypothetical protein
VQNGDPPGEELAVKEIGRAVAKMQAGVLAVVFALLGGGSLFLMTVWLLIRSGPNVGAHLRLLSNYFPGYSVTWLGSFVGFLYGALVGGLIGWSIGTIYNKIARLRQR